MTLYAFDRDDHNWIIEDEITHSGNSGWSEIAEIDVDLDAEEARLSFYFDYASCELSSTGTMEIEIAVDRRRRRLKLIFGRMTTPWYPGSARPFTGMSAMLKKFIWKVSGFLSTAARPFAPPPQPTTSSMPGAGTGNGLLGSSGSWWKKSLYPRRKFPSTRTAPNWVMASAQPSTGALTTL